MSSKIVLKAQQEDTPISIKSLCTEAGNHTELEFANIK